MKRNNSMTTNTVKRAIIKVFKIAENTVNQLII